MRLRNPNLKLKALRIEHEIKQSDLADMIGISKTTYNRKENGFNEFTENEIKIICEIFNKEPSEIFFNNKVTKCIKP
ncbi:helix-turn-helix domain-containing protein [Bacteroidales bacterium MSK.15.36]|nr:helix-turn-helix domain-containing protein [Bacteroidales bacterium MSK.15.36]